VLALVHGRQRLGTKTVGPDLLLLERVWEERVEEDEEVDCAVRRRPTCHGGAGGEDGGASAVVLRTMAGQDGGQAGEIDTTEPRCKIGVTRRLRRRGRRVRRQGIGRRTRRFAAFRTGDRRTGCSLFSSNQCAGLGHNRSEALRWR